MLGGLRGWAEGYTRRGKYSPVGVWFHWIMAAVVLYQLGSGWLMDRQPVGADKLAVYASHSEIGLTLLVIAMLRGLWRLLVTDPTNDARSPRWQRRAARWSHHVFYVLFALLPLSGWCMWSAVQPAQPLHLAGLIPVPVMPFYDLSPEWQFRALELARDLHFWGVIGLALLIPLHVGAALEHHFWEGDDIVRGILPEIEDHESALQRPRKRAPKALQSPPG